TSLAPCQFWAPEVHCYQNAYYMFVTFPENPQDEHATWILRSERPEGPFRIWSEGPLRPEGWRTLDGTLYVDEEGAPWIVFCHEWVQIHAGTICAMPLTPDLKCSAGEAVELFHAYDAPWALRFGDNQENSVTDGPFLFHEEGKLKMFWSTIAEGWRYVMGTAVSESGKITGPWKQEPIPFCTGDCGHGMRFTTFDGKVAVVVHQPNCGDIEHPVFI
ncbi:MAG: family 43 glycosylhydrolase, partial [Victivallales bacterium]|nr:family 43 glycosylhydrolase [Victivallales bacterium]